MPNLAYVYLAYILPDNVIAISIAVFIENFGYGFGFTLYMLFLLYFAQGESKAAHYAICTGCMALSLAVPGITAGWITDNLGYYNSFLVVMGLVPITFWVTSLIKVPNEFGQKSTS